MDGSSDARVTLNAPAALPAERLGRVVLASVDADRNRFRFYVLELARDGTGVLLRIRWGRLGTNGREAIERFPSRAAADDACMRLVARREQRGYARLIVHHMEARTMDHENGAELGCLLMSEAELVAALARTRRAMVSLTEQARRRGQIATPSPQLALFESAGFEMRGDACSSR